MAMRHATFAVAMRHMTHATFSCSGVHMVVFFLALFCHHLATLIHIELYGPNVFYLSMHSTLAYVLDRRQYCTRALG